MVVDAEEKFDDGEKKMMAECAKRNVWEINFVKRNIEEEFDGERKNVEEKFCKEKFVNEEKFCKEKY